jgi:drug/metabolite transporter (DMT)-like permease
VLAAHAGAIGKTLRHWRAVLPFAAIEMAVPWLLLSDAEKRLPSGLTGLLIACVPLVGTLLAYVLGDHAVLRPVRLAGIAIGLSGVALLVGGDLGGAGGIPWWSVAEVLLVCVCYAIGPFVIARRLRDVPTLGVVAVSLAAVAIVTAPLAYVARPSETPPASTWWAIVGLAVVCTGLAFVVFFALIEAIGPARATLITFANPAVAVILGAVVLGEDITAATVGGFVLVITGCVLATRPGRVAEDGALLRDSAAT